MSKIRKIASVIMALVMIVALATGAFAYNIELKGSTQGHTYSVFQIFTGELEDGKLTNIKYGANYTPDDTTTETLVPQSELDTLTDARAFAEELVQNGLLEGDAVATLNQSNNWTVTGMAVGYYLIQDVTENLPEYDTYSAYIVEITDDTEIKTKAGTTSLDKIITGDNNSVEDDIAADQKTDNVSVGSVVYYELTSKIPANAKDFDFFYFIISDLLSEGLTFNNDVAVTIAGVTQTAGTDYVVHTGEDADGFTFQMALLNAIEHSGATVKITYSATLNENAVIGEVFGNTNTAGLTFSNDPNFDYDGTDDNDDGKPDDPGTPPPTEPGDEPTEPGDEPTEPSKPGEGSDIPLGNTPDMVTRTYTTGIKILKVDDKGEPLTGAEFQITGTNVVDVLVVEEEVFTEDENGTYYLLNNGTYTQKAPTEETAEHYASTTVKYTKTIEYKKHEIPVGETTHKAYVDENGYVTFAGLGQGEYTITETVVPDGYNDIDPIHVVISWQAPASGSQDCTWTATADGEVLELNADGVFELTVVNRPGATLPETGGIGTTVFYIVGAVLAVGTAVLLITKKRMSYEA